VRLSSVSSNHEILRREFSFPGGHRPRGTVLHRLVLGLPVLRRLFEGLPTMEDGIQPKGFSLPYFRERGGYPVYMGTLGSLFVWWDVFASHLLCGPSRGRTRSL